MKHISTLEKSFSWMVACIISYILAYLGIVIDPSLALSGTTVGIYALITGITIIPTFICYRVIEKLKQNSVATYRQNLHMSALSAYFSPFNKYTRKSFEDRGLSTIIALGRPGKTSEVYQWRFVENHKEASQFMNESPHSWEMVVLFDNQDVLPIRGLVASTKSV